MLLMNKKKACKMETIRGDCLFVIWRETCARTFREENRTGTGDNKWAETVVSTLNICVIDY
jgi:hypothetical protein